MRDLGQGRGNVKAPARAPVLAVDTRENIIEGIGGRFARFRPGQKKRLALGTR